MQSVPATESELTTVATMLARFSQLPVLPLLRITRCRDYFRGLSEAGGDLSVADFAQLSFDALAALPLTSEDCALLTSQLNSLVQNQSPSSTVPIGTYKSRSDLDTGPSGISSVAQEQLLTEALSQLASFEHLGAVAKHPLGKYWANTALRAPFEEQITLGQFAKLTARSLLAKRSMTPAKIVAMTEAINRAMSEYQVPTSAISKSLNGLPAESLSQPFMQRLLEAALYELNASQRARVLAAVAMPGQLLAPKRKSHSKKKKPSVQKKRNSKTRKSRKEKSLVMKRRR